MQFDPLTQKIIGSCFQVYNTLGFGFLESVYENSLVIELQKNNLRVQTQQPITVYYDEQPVGQYVADMIVENKVIVELKSIQKLVDKHEAQLVNYLVATKTEVGLLINFGPNKVEVRRKFRTYRPHEFLHKDV